MPEKPTRKRSARTRGVRPICQPKDGDQRRLRPVACDNYVIDFVYTLLEGVDKIKPDK